MAEHKPRIWKFGTDQKINPLVDAACCLANNNKLPNGEPMFDIETHFDSWMVKYVRDEIEKRTRTK